MNKLDELTTLKVTLICHELERDSIIEVLESRISQGLDDDLAVTLASIRRVRSRLAELQAQ